MKDRFVVEMKGRLRLDKLQQYIETYLHESHSLRDEDDEQNIADNDDSIGRCDDAFTGTKEKMSRSRSFSYVNYGQLYFNKPKSHLESQKGENIQSEVEKAVPLSEMVASAGDLSMLHESRMRSCSTEGRLFRKSYSLLSDRAQTSGDEVFEENTNSYIQRQNEEDSPLTNDLKAEFEGTEVGLLGALLHEQCLGGIPTIPLSCIKLLEALGTGRVSTVYRSIWERVGGDGKDSFKVVALKVAVAHDSNGQEHLNELKKEADIASSLNHQNICKLLGVAYDSR